VAAVEALAVVAEAAVAFELARAAREKFGGDALVDFVAAHRAYVERIPWRTR
jgi:chorismate synthase